MARSAQRLGVLWLARALRGAELAPCGVEHGGQCPLRATGDKSPPPQSSSKLEHSKALRALAVLAFFLAAHAWAAPVTTAIGDGADAYIKRDGSEANTGTAAGVWVKTAGGGANATDRKGYLRFDLSTNTAAGADGAAITGGSLRLVQSAADTIAHTINVYGLNDLAAADAPAGWVENGLTWANAPANDTASANGVTSAATLLGSFTIPANATAGALITFSSAALTTFLQSDTNDRVTFILTRANNGTLQTQFAAKENVSSYDAPTLNVTRNLYPILPTAPRIVPLKDTDYPIPASGVYYVAPTGSSGNSGTLASPWSVSKALGSSGAPAGSTVIFRGGEYRGVNSVSLTRKLTLQAYPHELPFLKGSLVIPDAEWIADGPLWRKDGWTYEWPLNVGTEYLDTSGNYDLAGNRDMVFINDEPLTQVATKDDVGPGTFCVDYAADKIYIGDNPTGRKVESAAYFRALSSWFDSNPDGFIVRGLGFTHYADYAIQTGSERSVFENCTFMWNGVQGITINTTSGRATDCAVRGCQFVANGRKGLSGSPTRSVIEGNLFAFNNVENFRTAWDAAGLKLTECRDVIFRNNVVENNNSTGLWLDISVIRSTAVGNIARHNRSIGLFNEISHDAIFAFNTCYDNSTGIMVSGSSGIRVWNNTLTKNNTNLTVKDAGRVNDVTVDDGVTGGGGTPDGNPIEGGEDESEAREGSLWMCRDNEIKNNLLSNLKTGSTNVLLDADGSARSEPTTLLIASADWNGYHRSAASFPTYAFQWRSAAGTAQSFTNLPRFRTVYPAFEANALAIDNATNPFFNATAEADDDYQLKPGSVALNRGEPLPADIAAVATDAGVSVAPLNLGALPSFGASALVVSKTALSVIEGDSGIVTVRLSAKPAADVTVTVARTAGSTDVSVAQGAALTFTPANYATPQVVTISAKRDTDTAVDTATMSVSANGFTTRDVAVSALEESAPAFTTTAPARAISGVAWSYAAAASGTPAPTFALVTAPAGMTIDARTGVVAWTPPAVANTNVTISASNGVGADATQTFTIQAINAPAASLQDSGADKLLVIEAENFTAKTFRGAHGWEPAAVAGASGSGAMTTTPDLDYGVNTDAANNIFFSNLSPRMDYRVEFVTTGTHYVWARGLGGASGTNNSIHVGLDGAEVTTADRIDGFPAGSLGWVRATLDGPIATIDVATAGLHTISVWMREDGAILDKLLLTTNAAYTPAAAGPAASAQTAVAITATDASAAELGANPGTFTLARTGGTTAALVVDFSTSGTATAADYTPAFTGLATIPAGSASTTLTLTPVADTLAEGSETATLTPLANAAYSTTAAGTVTIADKPMDDWRFTQFGAAFANDPAIAGDLADFDRDGLGTLLEYAVSANPLVANANTQVLHSIETVAGKKYQALTITKNPLATDVTYTVEVGNNLVVPNWNTTNTVIVEDTATTLKVRDIVELPLALTPRFLRLKITCP